MASAPVSRRSGLWKLASLLALLLLALRPAVAAPSRLLLALPVNAPWVLDPVAAAVTKTWSEALQTTGCSVAVCLPGSVYVAMIQRDEWAAPAEVAGGNLDDVRYALALEAHADVILTSRLSVEGANAVLEATLEDPFAQRPITMKVTAPQGPAPDQVGQALARALAAQITPKTWVQLPLDTDSRRQSAAARYAAGQRAEKEGRGSEAALEFELASVGDPTQADYLLAEARALDACKRPEQAYLRAQRAAQLKPGAADCTRTVAEYALHAKRYEQAEAAFNQVLAASPQDPVALEGAARRETRARRLRRGTRSLSSGDDRDAGAAARATLAGLPAGAAKRRLVAAKRDSGGGTRSAVGATLCRGGGLRSVSARAVSLSSADRPAGLHGHRLRQLLGGDGRRGGPPDPGGGGDAARSARRGN